MSKVLIGFLAAVLAVSSISYAGAKPTAAPTPSSAPSNLVVIPGGTLVHVALVDKISSSNGNVGDTFGIVATENVTVDGWIVIAKGGVGQGEIASVDRAGSHGHPGSLGIQMDWIFAVDGEKLHLTSQRNTSEGEGKQGASSTLTVVSWLALGLPGLFAHNFVHGKDITLDGTRTLDSFTADNAHITATTKASDDGFAH